MDSAGNLGAAGSAYTGTIDTSTSSTTVSITAVADDQGLLQGNLANGSSTDDTIPVYSLTLSAALGSGDVLRVYDNGQLIPAAQISGSGTSYTYTPASALADGSSHIITAQVMDAAGNLGSLSAPHTVLIDSVAPATSAEVSAVQDNIGLIQGNVANGGSTDDQNQVLNGTLSAALAAGETVRLYDGSTYLGNASVSGTDWTYTDTRTLANASTYSYTARVMDSAGNLGAAGSAYTGTIDTTLPNTAIVITKAMDDQGSITGSMINGAVTDDTLPVYTLTASLPVTADEVIHVYDNGIEVATISGTGVRTYTYTPVIPYPYDSTHSLTAAVSNALGNRGLESSAFTLTFLNGATAPANFANVTAITDNVGILKGTLADGGSTDDQNLQLAGNLNLALDAATGEKVAVFDNDIYLGDAVVSGTTWAYVDQRTLADGTNHVFSARVLTVAGTAGPQGATRTATIDMSAPDKPSFTLANDNGYDDVPNVDGITNDGTVNIILSHPSDTWEYSTNAGLNWKSGVGLSFVLPGNTHYAAGQVQVHAVDGSGNVSAPAFNSIPLDIDQQSPLVAISGPALMGSGSTYTITFTFNEDPGHTFELGDIDVVGGFTSNLTGSGLTRSVNFLAGPDTSASISIKSDKFTDVAGNSNKDGAEANNTLVIPVNNAAPKVAMTIGAGAATLAMKAGETATLSFVFTQDPGTTFTVNDISVVGGGNITNLTKVDATHYTATYTPPALTTGISTLNIASSSFANIVNLSNIDGADSDNTVTVSVDTQVPTVNITGPSTVVKAGETPTITFNFSEDPGTSFTVADVVVTGGGSLSGLAGTGTTRTAIYTPLANSITPVNFGIASNTFQDAAGNPNADGGELNNYFNLSIDTVRPTVAVSTSKSLTGEGEDLILTFTFSEDPGTSFTIDDIVLTHTGTATTGTFNGITGSGTTRQVKYLPDAGETGTTTFSVASDKFTDPTGNLNKDGADTDNRVLVNVDTIDPVAPSRPLVSDNVWPIGQTGTGVHDGNIGSGNGGLYGTRTDDITPTFYGNAGAVEANATVSVYDNGALIGSVVAAADGSWSYTHGSALTATTHTITIRQADLAGNLSVASSGFSLIIESGNIVVGSTSPSVGDNIDNSANATAYVYYMQGGDDTVRGGAGNDVMSDYGSLGQGADTFYGGGGDDTMRLGGADTSNDFFDGGAGRDMQNYEYAVNDVGNLKVVASDTVLAGVIAGNVTNIGTNKIGTDTFNNVEIFVLANGDDVFDSTQVSGAIGVVVYLYGGVDTVDTGMGADVVYDFGPYGAGGDDVHLGGGNDELYAGDNLNQNDTYAGGDGADAIWYNTQAPAGLVFNIKDDVVAGQPLLEGTITGADNGTDTVTGFEYYLGGRGNDSMDFSGITSTPLVLAGNDGDDVIKGSTVADIINASGTYGGGKDTISAGAGDDMLWAGSERNYSGALVASDDTFDGGAGFDILYYHSGGTIYTGGTASTQSITLKIYQDSTKTYGTAVGADIGTDSFTSFEQYSGGNANDTIIIDNTVTNAFLGPNNYTLLFGYGGNDNITGSDNASEYYYAMTTYDNGADTINLGGGNDTIRAGNENSVANDSYALGAGDDFLDLRFDAQVGGTITLSGTGTGTIVGYGMGTDSFSGVERIISKEVTDLFLLNTDYAAFVNGGATVGYGYLNGGSGIQDKVRLGTAINLDLTASTTRMFNVPWIDLSTTTTANSFIFDRADIIDLGVIGVAANGSGGWTGTGLDATREQVVVMGSAADTLVDNAIGANGWSLVAGTASFSGRTYNVYNNSAINAQLIVDQAIVQTGVLG